MIMRLHYPQTHEYCIVFRFLPIFVDSCWSWAYLDATLPILFSLPYFIGRIDSKLYYCLMEIILLVFLCERTRQTFRLPLMSNDDYQKLAIHLIMADTFDVSIL